MIHLLLNCDEFLAAQAIVAIKQGFVAQALAPCAEGGRTPTPDERAAALALAAANTVDVDGSSARGPEVLAAAMTVSLFAEPRLVIVRGYLAALRERIGRSKDESSAAPAEYRAFVQALDDLPDETGLVLVDQLAARKRAETGGEAGGKEAGKERQEIDLKLIQDAVTKMEAAQRGKVHSLPTPQPGRALEQWIQERAAARQMRFQGPVVHLLMDRIGPDLRRLDNELEKLALYAGSRAITDADVRLLVADTGEEAIWGLTDGLSERNSAKAFHTLAELWQDDQPPFAVLGSIAANYRLILRVKAVMESGGGERDARVIMKAVGARSEFPITKAMRVAPLYGFHDLEDVMARLLDANLAMVSGSDPQLEIELLVADLTLKPRTSQRSQVTTQ